MAKINLNKKQLKAACSAMVLIEEDFMKDIKEDTKVSEKDWINMRARICKLAGK